MAPPDADWWTGYGGEQVTKTREQLEAEVRLLRATLVRISDELGEAKSWESLRATAHRAKLHAVEALRRTR